MKFLTLFLRKIWWGGAKWGFKGEWNCCSQEVHGFQFCSLASLFQSHLVARVTRVNFRCCSWFLLLELLHPLPAPRCAFSPPPWHTSWCWQAPRPSPVLGRCSWMSCQKQLCCMWAGHQSWGKEDKWEDLREGTSSFWHPLEWFTLHLSFILRPRIFDVYAPFHLRGKVVLGQSKLKKVQNEKLMHLLPAPLRPFMQRKSFWIGQKVLPLDFDPHFQVRWKKFSSLQILAETMMKVNSKGIILLRLKSAKWEAGMWGRGELGVFVWPCLGSAAGSCPRLWKSTAPWISAPGL